MRLENDVTLSWTQSLIAQVVLKDPKTGEAIYIAEDRTLVPGETLSWTYPEGGVVFTVS
jgi:hypothetical protein